MVDEQAEAHRKTRVDMTGAPRLQQQHARARVLAEARGQHRARRARPDDDVVVLIQALASPLLVFVCLWPRLRHASAQTLPAAATNGRQPSGVSSATAPAR